MLGKQSTLNGDTLDFFKVEHEKGWLREKYLPADYDYIKMEKRKYMEAQYEMYRVAKNRARAAREANKAIK